ncbi:MAG: YidC/Oxa1 family membrane protein insertase [Candidatus Gracilibacteria bacterium]|nr:YidC/Oxa1 family membrane protein insertase [Candidatus Gracilibacteria bacterium]
MNTRLLNFLLIFFITLIALNWILPKPTQNTTPNNEIILSVGSTSYVTPDIPVIEIQNTTSASITIDTCRDFSIKKDHNLLTNPPKEFCKTLTIGNGAKEKLDISPLYRLFQSPGKYEFSLTVNGKTSYGDTLGEVPGFFRSLFRNLFYAPIYNLFAFLISTLPGYSFGLAIILVTIFIRIILLVPQHHILANSKKMQAIQPKIKELQEKYKGDQAKIGMELMALYKAEQVNPLGSCLPLLIQMPLLIVLYWVVLEITLLSNYFYLYSPLASFDISKIDTVFFGIHLLSIGGITGIILALAVGGAQWFQIKLSLPKEDDVKKLEKLEKKIIEKKDGKYTETEPSFMPDPSVMNKFMLWGMPAMIAVSTFFFPAGVGIYWLIGTLFMLGQQIVVNKMSEKKK